MALQINYPPFSNTTKALMDFGSGNAPTLNYQLPQKTAFTSYSDFYLPVPDDAFLSNARVVNVVEQAKDFLQKIFTEHTAALLCPQYSLLRESYCTYLDDAIATYNQKNKDKVIVSPTFEEFAKMVMTCPESEPFNEGMSLSLLFEYIKYYKLLPYDYVPSYRTFIADYIDNNTMDSSFFDSTSLWYYWNKYKERAGKFLCTPDDFKVYVFGYSSIEETEKVENFSKKFEVFLKDGVSSQFKSDIKQKYSVFKYDYVDVSDVPNLLSIKEFVECIKDYSIIRTESLGGFGYEQEFVKRPEKANPCLFIVEEYKTASFLGNYGAGKTVKTFTLLPNEKTTITIKSYTESKETQTKSESIMDSLTENSSKEMESLLQSESHFEDKSDTSVGSTTTTDQTDKISAKAEVSCSTPKFLRRICKVSAAAKAAADKTTTTKTASIKESKTARSQNVDNLSKALQKHSETCNAHRQMDINTTSTISVTTTETQSTVRTLVNPNLSRVLNFVFRQLQQEYITITYLNSVQIAFCNGNTESFRTVPIQQLDDLLNDLVKGRRLDGSNVINKQADVREMIVNRYLTVENYQDTPMPFLERSPKGYYRKKGKFTDENGKVQSGVLDVYQHLKDGKPVGLPIYVNGIILKVDVNILRTDSVIVDSLLGTGEALDEFNLKTQEAKVQALYLDNLKLDKAISVLEQVPNPMQRADLFGKIFNPPITVVRN